MEYIVKENHRTEFPNPICLKKGERVILGKKSEETVGETAYDENWPNWTFCSRMDGSNKGWVPDQIIEKDGCEHGLVVEDYSAKELYIDKGTVVEGIKQLNGWLWSKNKSTNEIGWIPMDKLENKQPTVDDLIIESHVGLERQGPGSPEIILKALSFLDSLNNISRVADLACGTGGQTMVLAQNIAGHITGVDICPDFINVFNDNAKKLNLQERVNGIVGSMKNLTFQKEEFDLIWSEGAIDSIGFEKGLTHWNSFLKKNGYVAVTCPSWLTDERPAEIEKFWADAGGGLDTIGYNISIMQKAGYSFVAAFTLPEKCWTDNYFTPREAADKALLEKYPGNKTVEAYIKDEKYEVELYLKYKQHYGYVFYIGQKV